MSASLETRTHASFLLDTAAKKLEEKVDAQPWLTVADRSTMSEMGLAELDADRAVEKHNLTQDARTRAIFWVAYRLQTHDHLSEEESIAQATLHVARVENTHQTHEDGLRRLYVTLPPTPIVLQAPLEVLPQVGEFDSPPAA